MTNAQKLEALVRRAVKNGWTDNDTIDGDPAYYVEWLYNNSNAPGIYDVIYSHDFARALFGADPSETISFEYMSASLEAKKPLIGSGLIPVYCHHLQQAVISKDPIDYYYNEVFKNGR